MNYEVYFAESELNETYCISHDIEEAKLICERLNNDSSFVYRHGEVHYRAYEPRVGIEGLSPDQAIVTNERGGKQSSTPYAFHLCPPEAMFSAAKTLAYGAERYGAENWRNIDIPDHLNHALQHIFGYLAGDVSDEHLSHALVRLMFAHELELKSR